ncbi:AraC family transcriptional regulator [Foetidibacter luteolus]|uniref:AraC family transcriptional regulator n=1 Tax=Foetidibacter luteolus TaxID=2608880 RepID=UPI00129B3306|nr:AraC family transcriptional regulator [Foetidibacter luteolus]
MKPVLEHLPPKEEESFFVQAFDLPYFGTPWHYHPEFELVLIEESEGKRFVGNATSDFKKGDLSFLGANLPHLYRNPPVYYDKHSSLRAKSIVIHFREASLGKDFFSLPQMKKVNQFLERSAQGVDILGNSCKAIAAKMREMTCTTGISRLVLLLEILDMLAGTDEYSLVSGAGIVGHNSFDADRLNKVFQFILQNFHREIRLEEAASLVYMTRTSFCRFFLERTKRTFSDYLCEVRLNHAAKLLIEKDLKITRIASESGYNNLSNFNRQFKEKYKMSPQQYRQLYLKEKAPVFMEGV